MKLSALIDERDFILLAPGFGDSPRWQLLRKAHVAHEPRRESVWLARYEQSGQQARPWAGVIEEIDLEFDLPAPSLIIEFDERGFVEEVETIRRAIAAGDVYQVNLTRSAWVECESGAHLLATLCRRGVPRFGAWVRLEHCEFVSASPELLFDLTGRRLRAEPMKGTAAPDQRRWLESSIKDQAELAMITDLLRDDLHHLCVPRSVHVRAARRFLELPYAVQAVSDIEGQLQAQMTLPDVLAQLHPGGSVTGAPRQAARALIGSLEATPRDFYCGFLALQRHEHTRAALLIRTAQRAENSHRWRYGVGSGITWGSQALDELAEVRLKLGALS